MKLLFLFFLVSCGGENRSTCISRDSKILECRAVEAADRYYTSPYQLELDKQKCERTYPVKKCY